MGLDINKLSQQIQAASFEWRFDQQAYLERLERVMDIWEKASQYEEKLIDKFLTSPHLPWSMGRPLEKLNQRFPLPEVPLAHRILAVDGSQIAPSHHEISPCYLINLGKIQLTYGPQAQAQMQSEPLLYYRQADLYTSAKRQQISVTEQNIGLERSLIEFQALAELVRDHSSASLPTLAILDGSLFNFLFEWPQWAESVQKQVIQRLNQILHDLSTCQIPLCGYISQSRRTDILNLLRLQRCPYEKALCDTYCPEGQEACADLFPLTDREWAIQILQPGERSAVFAATQILPPGLEKHALCFFYLHVGTEIARIEIPRWVVDQPLGLDTVQALAYAQAQKGQGYPIALAEAHHRAVVTGSDRKQFYAMLSRQMMREHLGVRLSPKEVKKRRGMV